MGQLYLKKTLLQIARSQAIEGIKSQNQYFELYMETVDNPFSAYSIWITQLQQLSLSVISGVAFYTNCSFDVDSQDDPVESTLQQSNLRVISTGISVANVYNSSILMHYNLLFIGRNGGINKLVFSFLWWKMQCLNGSIKAVFQIGCNDAFPFSLLYPKS